MKLGKNQRMAMRFAVRKGIGKNHAKWSPVATCIMHKEPIVELDQGKVNGTMSIPQRKGFVAACPRKVYTFNELNQEVEVEKAGECTLCIECQRFAEAQGLDNAVKIAENNHKFIFTVESTGALPPVEIVRKAMRILKEKVSTFGNDLSNYVNRNVGYIM
jgi:DNA-directed RNA polymerase II subunit RPB3